MCDARRRIDRRAGRGTDTRMMPALRRLLLAVVAAAALSAGLFAQAPPAGGLTSIESAALREWLAYIASDELGGRATYSEGLGLAASYIAEHLEKWGVKPAAGDGSYFQTVKIVSVKNSGRSAVTVRANGQTRTFEDGQGISFSRNVGADRTVRAGDILFAGYGLQLSGAGYDDYEDLDPHGKVVVWLGPSGPSALGKGSPRLLGARSRLALEKGALAVIAPPLASGRGGRGTNGGADDRRERRAADFVTAQRLDLPLPPVVSAEEAFLEFLFSGAKIPYAELKARAERQEPLPHFALHGVELTFHLEPEYSIVSTRLSRNVVGIVEGSDPELRRSYVAFGAHYDHVGYREEPSGSSASSTGSSVCPGQPRPEPRPGDVVYNGADDDGTGVVALMAIARAFAEGPRPRRSLLFVWHTAEEAGLQGSRYNADYPVVPNEQIVAHLNIDMIGRNRCDDPGQANTVYLVGSDRISTELHNVSEDANAALERPMTLDYELNDPADPQSLYTRSDHYSYAAKGIPVIFYTTGLHRDYHALTDEIDKIEFDKLTRVTRLIHATGARLANLERPPDRDNRGPRAGKGKGGKLEER